MKKERILAEIKRTAKENGGKPLGKKRFEKITGIKERDWLGKFWARWNDVVSEAGLTPNTMQEAYSDEQLLQSFVSMIREIDRFPTRPELQLHRRNDPDFPSPECITRRWGCKSDVASRVMEYCVEQGELDDVFEICSPIASPSQAVKANDAPRYGHVYLLKHDNAYRIGRSTDISRRYKEIRVQMPHETEEIHVIETDDPSGIEAYRHNRFKDKRLQGEWFNLSPSDVKAFKRRKFM